MIDPNDLALFARVAESGSFTKAAERLKLPKSTVSRRLSALETQLGERLLQRTTRKLTLTEFGLALLDHARQVVAEVDAVAALAMHRQAQPSGRLRVTGSLLRPRSVDYKRAVKAQLLARIWPLLEAGAVRPIVDSVHALDDAPTAHARMESGAHIGKILLRVGAEAS